jgi:hypothetical protein
VTSVVDPANLHRRGRKSWHKNGTDWRCDKIIKNILGLIVSETVLLCMGYTCLCGERVTAFRVQTNGAAGNRLSSKTVTCKNGHVRLVTVDQLRTLDHWIEETEDEQELATGT